MGVFRQSGRIVQSSESDRSLLFDDVAAIGVLEFECFTCLEDTRIGFNRHDEIRCPVNLAHNPNRLPERMRSFFEKLFT